jgi:hypothetical protein
MVSFREELETMLSASVGMGEEAVGWRLETGGKRKPKQADGY